MSIASEIDRATEISRENAAHNVRVGQLWRSRPGAWAESFVAFITKVHVTSDGERVIDGIEYGDDASSDMIHFINYEVEQLIENYELLEDVP